jgi:excisionase family DNA binding protein
MMAVYGILVHRSQYSKGGYMSQNNLLTANEVAAILGVKPRTIQYWVKRGYFPGAYKVGLGATSPYRIPQSDVEAFIEKRERQGKAATSDE